MSSSKKEKKRDQRLFAALLVLNGVSGSTTISGAAQILPLAVGIPAGFIIQVMLLLLLSGSTAIHAPIRKWAAVIVLSLFSIHTSFFAYYGQMTKDSQEQIANDRAIEAHNNLVAQVLTPLKDDARSYKESAAHQRQLSEAEASEGITTGFLGRGPEARKFALKAKEFEAEYARREALIGEIEGKFNYKLEDLTPAQILAKDRKALALVPQEYRGDYTINRSQYVDEETDVDILTPYYKVKRSELPAISALGLAGIIDGLIIWLGTAIMIQQRTSLPEVLRKLKKFWANIIKVSGQTVTPELMPEDAKMLAIPLDTVMELGASSAVFLSYFYDAIDNGTGEINYTLLEETGKAIVFYKMLLDSMRKLGWVKLKEDNWYIKRNHYDQCTEWVIKEIHRLSKLETKNGHPGHPYKPLTIDVPSSSPQQGNKHQGLPGGSP
ncbi:MAG: hypothetical protein F6K47_34715 [Symploca sp. SIO2E6]|nr:hypothetical protein [Symploca sp. SIO2E6]